MIPVQLTHDSLITFMDESELIKTVRVIDNKVERTVETYYHLKSDPDGRPVHKSVDIKLKIPAVFADGGISGFF
jgi:hypothetical protein